MSSCALFLMLSLAAATRGPPPAARLLRPPVALGPGAGGDWTSHPTSPFFPGKPAHWPSVLLVAAPTQGLVLSHTGERWLPVYCVCRGGGALVI